MPTDVEERERPRWQSLLMYELTDGVLDNAYKRLAKMRDRREPEPVVVPLGRKWDAAHYLLYRYKPERKGEGPTLKIYQISFARVAGRRLASCDCWAGTKEIPCYHLALTIGIHETWTALERAGLLLVPTPMLPVPAMVAERIETFLLSGERR
jgi:hypothetical protein